MDFNIKNFSISQWEETYDYVNKNITGMNIKVSVNVLENKTIIKISQLDKQYEVYRRKLEDLIIWLVKGTYVVGYHLLCDVSYAEECDKDVELDKGKKCLFDNFQMYLNLLFEEGKEKLFSVLGRQSNLFSCAYRMSKMSYTENGWTFGTEAFLKDGLWHVKDGTPYYDLTADIITRIVE